MTDKPKRRLWQIRLSTAIVSTLVAIVLVCLNITNRTYGRMPDYYGWPLCHYSEFDGLYRMYLLVNVAVCFIIVVLMGGVFDFYIRFREAAKPRRHWLQLHLSTAVVLMFVAGALIWINLQPATVLPDMTTNEPIDVFGWPCIAVTRWSAFAMSTKEDVFVVTQSGFLINGIIAMLLLGILTVAFEWILFRREARTP